MDVESKWIDTTKPYTPTNYNYSTSDPVPLKHDKAMYIK